jgi:hypothetical protein
LGLLNFLRWTINKVQKTIILSNPICLKRTVLNQYIDYMKEEEFTSPNMKLTFKKCLLFLSVVNLSSYKEINLMGVKLKNKYKTETYRRKSGRPWPPATPNCCELRVSLPDRDTRVTATSAAWCVGETAAVTLWLVDICTCVVTDNIFNRV